MRAVAAALILLGCACCGGAPQPPPAPPLWEQPGLEGHVRPEMGRPQPGDPAPDFTLARTGGGSFGLADARGAWLLMHFTITWCPYCDAEVENVAALAERYRGQNVRVALVDVKEDAALWRRYVSEHVRSDALIVLEDRDGDASRRFAPPGAMRAIADRAVAMAAATVVIDPEGKIRLLVFPDTSRYDPTLAAIVSEMDRMRGVPGPSAAPARAQVAAVESTPLLAPEDVVTVSVAPLALHRGESSSLNVTLRVAPGYHTMSNRPSDELYVATTLALDNAAGLSAGAPVFPAATTFRLGSEELSVFGGDVIVRVPVTASADAAAGVAALRGTLRYQSCTTGNCLPPVTKPVQASVSIAP